MSRIRITLVTARSLHWRPWRSTRRHNHLRAVKGADAVSVAEDQAAGQAAAGGGPGGRGGRAVRAYPAAT